MPDETARRYLFVAIDRATRWVFIELYTGQTDGSSVDFLTKVQQACPVKIAKLLTDDGSIPQRELQHKTPIQALKEWGKKRPELFKKRVYYQLGLDT